jgi:hypothetical protein
MKIIENTRDWLGKKSIQTFLKNKERETVACNVNEAKSIGILFNATHQVSFEIVKALVKDLSTKKNKIDVLGFVDSKQLIDHYLYRKGFDFFTQSQLNWYYKPVVENVQKFIENPYDILIDLSLDDPFPIHYIIACSRAKFKVGRYYEGQDCLDFMIDMEKEKEAMDKIRDELNKDLQDKKKNNTEVERIVDKKAQTEIQLNFLINQLIHYLSLIKSS